VIVRATVIVLLPVEQDVDAEDEGDALAAASADTEGLGGAYRETEAILLAIARQALEGAPRAVLGMPAIKVLPGDHASAVEALRNLAERG
jgi:hypothetical protein